MNSYSQRDKTFIGLVCSVLFIGFTFCYLYLYQDGLLAAAQHILSNGMTTYNQTIGAITITAVLLIVHIVLSRLYSAELRGSAMSFLPELSMLAAITSFDITADNTISCGASFYFSVFMTVASIAILLILRATQPNVELLDKTLTPLQRIWMNILAMAFFLMFVGMLGNGDKTLHARLRMEQSLAKKDWTAALDIAKSTSKPDPSITMLTAYALANENLLSEKLFEYPIAMGSQCLQPHAGESRTIIYPEKNIVRCAKRVAAKDYKLCGYLLDKRLDDFVNALVRYCKVDSTLPKHYREAMIQYTHTRSNPKVVFQNSVAEADFQDFLKMEKDATDSKQRWNKLHDVYGNTYWFYSLVR